MKFAFTLLTYRPDHPSGIERAIAALGEGLRLRGHEVLFLTAGPSAPGDAAEPGLIRLESVRLKRPAVNADVMAAIGDGATVSAEVRRVLAEREVDVAVWAAPAWGLGHLSPAPPRVRTALLAHNEIRPRSANAWRLALDAADAVLPASSYLVDSARERGFDVSRWRVVPNALLLAPEPVAAGQRERLRVEAGLRTVSRAVLGKGHAGLLEHLPAMWSRPVEMVLAEADFEFERGETVAAMDACRRFAGLRPDVVRLLPALGWREVPAFMAGAAVTAISSLEPETFCFVAAEALSAGTPLVTFDLGYVPTLAGDAGVVVPLEAGFDGMWTALTELIGDQDAYHAASAAAPGRVADHTPLKVADAFLTAVA